MSEYVEKMIQEGKGYEDIIPLEYKSYKELYQKVQDEPQVESVPTPYDGWNQMIDGFDPGRLYVLGAPPKQGKTTLVTSLMYQIAKRDVKSLLFSYEVSWQEIVKTVAHMEEIDGLEPGQIDIPVYTFTELHRGGDKLQLTWLAEAIMRAKREGIKFIAIDHLHFLIPYQTTNNFSIVVGNIVREIKHMAVLFDIPIILLVPMKNLQSKRDPSFWDIRDSSMILHEADDVMIMYRLTVDRAKKMSTLNKGDKKLMSEEDYDDRYAPISVLSLELSRKRGSSGKIYLHHNGAYFNEIDKTMVAPITETWAKV